MFNWMYDQFRLRGRGWSHIYGPSDRPAGSPARPSDALEPVADLYFAAQTNFASLQSLLDNRVDPFTGEPHFEDIKVLASRAMYQFEQCYQRDAACQVGLYMAKYYLEHTTAFGQEEALRVANGILDAADKFSTPSPSILAQIRDIREKTQALNNEHTHHEDSGAGVGARV